MLSERRTPRGYKEAEYPWTHKLPFGDWRLDKPAMDWKTGEMHRWKTGENGVTPRYIKKLIESVKNVWQKKK